MAQRVGGNGLLDVSRKSLLFDHDEYHGTCEMGTPTIQEYIVLLTRL